MDGGGRTDRWTKVRPQRPVCDGNSRSVIYQDINSINFDFGVEFLRGRMSKCFSPIFLDVFFDVESDEKSLLIFDHQRPRYRRFSDFDRSRSSLPLSFFQKIENFFVSKVHEIWPI